MRIFIVGYMYSGKTTLGKRLAKQLGYSFFDTDQLLEASLQSSISDYFKNHGEIAFRKAEQDVLHRCLEYDQAIIATGGGLSCFFDNMAWMKTHGLVIYLHAEEKTILGRLNDSPRQRPLLSSLNDSEKRKKVQQQLKEREVFYSQAQLTFPAECAQASNLAKHIEDYFRFKATTFST